MRKVGKDELHWMVTLMWFEERFGINLPCHEVVFFETEDEAMFFASTQTDDVTAYVAKVTAQTDNKE